MIEPDLIISVRFLTAEEGGRQLPVTGNKYGCPIMIDGQGFDCRFIVDDEMLFELGGSYEIAVKLLNHDLAYQYIQEGMDITLWEGKTIAKGKILKMLWVGR